MAGVQNRSQFQAAIHTVGAYAYHFWMQDMKRSGAGMVRNIPSPVGELPPGRPPQTGGLRTPHPIGPDRPRLAPIPGRDPPPRRLVEFSLLYPNGLAQKKPSEWVVSHALRHSWPQFLAGSPESVTLKKFLASKIHPDRCGYADNIRLEKAA